MVTDILDEEEELKLCSRSLKYLDDRDSPMKISLRPLTGSRLGVETL